MTSAAPPAAAPPAAAPPAAARLAPAAVALLAVVPFLSALGGELLNYDDNYLVTESRAVAEARWAQVLDPRASRHDLGSEYLPVRDATYVLDAWLWGEERDGRRGVGPAAAFGFHLTSLLWYGLACGLFAALLRALVPGRPGLAAVGALLFAWHPVHAESVAWVAGRKDVVSGALAAGALLVHVRARERDAPAGYLLSAALAALACLAKSTATCLPLLVLALEGLAAPRVPLARRLLRAAPAFVACGAVALLAVWVAGRTGIRQPARPLADVLLADLPILRHYVVASLVPWDLRIHHGELLRAVLDPAAPRAAVALGSLAVLAPLVALAARTRSRLVRFAWLWALLGLVPVLNFVPAAQWVADRYLFLPVLGPCLLVALGLARLSTRAPRAARALAAVALVGAAGLAARRTLDFLTSEALWEAQLRAEPGDPLALRHLGDARLRRAAGADPAERERLAALAVVELGHALDGFARLNVPLPGHELEAALCLVDAWRLRGDLAAAVRAADQARARFPEQPAAHWKAGNVALHAGDLAGALAAYRAALAAARAPGTAVPQETREQVALAVRQNLLVLAGRAHGAGGREGLALCVRALVAAGDARARAALEELRALDAAAAAALEAELGGSPQ